LTTRGRALLATASAVLAASALMLVVVGEAVVTHAGLALHDSANLSVFVEHRSSVLVQSARLVTELGSVAVLGPAAVVAAALLRWRGVRLLMAMAPLLSLAVTGTLVATTKSVVGRARPPAHWRLAIEGDASFPSGHAGDSAAFYLTLAVVVAALFLRRPLARGLAVAAAAALEATIGLSRLELGVHWPTDVIGGWALGTTVALAVSIAAVLATRVPLPEPVDAGADPRLASSPVRDGRTP
jgi:membrane-associated phospholipid phosphatase